MRLLIIVSLLTLSLAALPAASQADDVVAHAGGVTGIASIQRADGSVSVLAQGSALKKGDIVKTESQSYARLSFTDGSELALRPESQIRIENYAFDVGAPASDTVVLQFLKGGFRALTGLIGKRGNADAYKVATRTATIGIRGTDYVARLCDESCKAEQAGVAARAPVGLEIAARIAAWEGEGGNVVANTGQSRSFGKGAPLYAGDLVRTSDAGYAVVVFSDGSRVTVQKDSAFLLSRYHFNAKAPESGNVFLEMVQGGARFVTGLIGKANNKAFHVNTVTATVGIRGTGFDIYCGPKGQEPASGSDAPAAGKCDQALYEYTWEGQTEIEAGGSTMPLATGSAGFVSEPGKKPQLLGGLPAFMRDNAAPRPDTVPVDMESLFGSSDQTARPGLYVSVLDGRVLVSQGADFRELRQGEAGFAAADGQIQLLNASPAFIQHDPYLRTLKFDPLSCLAQ